MSISRNSHSYACALYRYQIAGNMAHKDLPPCSCRTPDCLTNSDSSSKSGDSIVLKEVATSECVSNTVDVNPTKNSAAIQPRPQQRATEIWRAPSPKNRSSNTIVDQTPEVENRPWDTADSIHVEATATTRISRNKIETVAYRIQTDSIGRLNTQDKRRLKSKSKANRNSPRHRDDRTDNHVNTKNSNPVSLNPSRNPKPILDRTWIVKKDNELSKKAESSATMNSNHRYSLTSQKVDSKTCSDESPSGPVESCHRKKPNRSSNLEFSKIQQVFESLTSSKSDSSIVDTNSRHESSHSSVKLKRVGTSQFTPERNHSERSRQCSSTGDICPVDDRQLVEQAAKDASHRSDDTLGKPCDVFRDEDLEDFRELPFIGQKFEHSRHPLLKVLMENNSLRKRLTSVSVSKSNLESKMRIVVEENEILRDYLQRALEDTKKLRARIPSPRMFCNFKVSSMYEEWVNMLESKIQKERKHLAEVVTLLQTSLEKEKKSAQRISHLEDCVQFYKEFAQQVASRHGLPEDIRIPSESEFFQEKHPHKLQQRECTKKDKYMDTKEYNSLLEEAGKLLKKASKVHRKREKGQERTNRLQRGIEMHGH